ncbi:hypothetical protein PR048_003982 [Dryococelus australis]|uniref:Uncharacterized protein n=1 Tax=Dryococelus australis TaxID=614101 RepID=A0ABQ9I469_9NEOP|nr:hypothetical protein PR048_003982 [Dryococelus australis]
MIGSDNCPAPLPLPTRCPLSKVLPYFSSKAFLMSPRSISERDTTMRISVLSLVPSPAMESWRRSAKNPTLLFTHFTANKEPHYTSTCFTAGIIHQPHYQPTRADTKQATAGNVSNLQDKPAAASHNKDSDSFYSTRVVRALPPSRNSSELRRWELAHQFITKSRQPPGLNIRQSQLLPHTRQPSDRYIHYQQSSSAILLGHTNGQQTLLDVARELLLDGSLYVVARKLLVLCKGLPQLLIAPRHHDRSRRDVCATCYHEKKGEGEEGLLEDYFRWESGGCCRTPLGDVGQQWQCILVESLLDSPQPYADWERQETYHRDLLWLVAHKWSTGQNSFITRSPVDWESTVTITSTDALSLTQAGGHSNWDWHLRDAEVASLSVRIVYSDLIPPPCFLSPVLEAVDISIASARGAGGCDDLVEWVLSVILVQHKNLLICRKGLDSAGGGRAKTYLQRIAPGHQRGPALHPLSGSRLGWPATSTKLPASLNTLNASLHKYRFKVNLLPDVIIEVTSLRKKNNSVTRNRNGNGDGVEPTSCPDLCIGRAPPKRHKAETQTTADPEFLDSQTNQGRILALPAACKLHLYKSGCCQARAVILSRDIPEH